MVEKSHNQSTEPVAALIVSYNYSDYTIFCIESLLQSDYTALSIIVLDNGSNNSDYQKLKYYCNETIKLVRIQDNVGYTKGINILLGEASKTKAKYYLILNNDTIIDPNAISELVACSLRWNDRCIVSGKVYEYDHPDVLQYVGGRYVNTKYLLNSGICNGDVDNGQYDQEVERDMLDDIYWLIPAELYNCIGGYDSSYFMYAEQDDYALRAKKAGYKLVYTYRAKLWHKGALSSGGSNESNMFVVYHKARSLLIFRYKHLNSCIFWKLYISNIWQLIVRGLLIETISALKNKRRAKYTATIVRIKGIMAFNAWYIRIVFACNIKKTSESSRS